MTKVMTATPSQAVASLLQRDQLPVVLERTMKPAEIKTWVSELASHPELWDRYVEHDGESRHFVSLYRDSNIDVWLLCWNVVDDTGWHDHDTSSGAVAVTRGSVHESRPRLGGKPSARTVSAGNVFAFGPDHIHRMAGAENGSVSIHAYSPPLWRMGQYSISDSGVMRRRSVSYADELRPIDG